MTREMRKKRTRRLGRWFVACAAIVLTAACQYDVDVADEQALTDDDGDEDDVDGDEDCQINPSCEEETDPSKLVDPVGPTRDICHVEEIPVLPVGELVSSTQNVMGAQCDDGTIYQAGTSVIRRNPDKTVAWKNSELCDQLGDGQCVYDGLIALPDCSLLVKVLLHKATYLARFSPTGEVLWKRKTSMRVEPAMGGSYLAKTAIEVPGDGDRITVAGSVRMQSLQNENNTEQAGRQGGVLITEIDLDGAVLETVQTIIKNPVRISKRPDNTWAIVGFYDFDYGSPLTLAVYDRAGTELLKQTITGRQEGIHISSLLPMADGSTVITGSFQLELTLRDNYGHEVSLTAPWCEVSSRGYVIGRASFLGRYSAQGELLYVIQIPAPDLKNRASIVSAFLDAEQGIVVFGHLMGEVTFGPGEVNQTVLAQNQGAYLARFRLEDGALDWAERIQMGGTKCYDLGVMRLLPCGKMRYATGSKLSFTYTLWDGSTVTIPDEDQDDEPQYGYYAAMIDLCPSR